MFLDKNMNNNRAWERAAEKNQSIKKSLDFYLLTKYLWMVK